MTLASTLSRKSLHFNHGLSTPANRFAMRAYSEQTLSESHAIRSRINCPSSLPPPLTLPPPRKESEYRVLYAYKVGKSYLGFYKTGLKQVFDNRKIAKRIRAQYDNHPLLRGIPGDAVDHKTGQLISVDTPATEKLSRAEYQLIRRHARDVKKVPIFAVLLAIFGEWLPLFVIFLDPLIPGTVLLPSQVLKRRRKAAKASSPLGIEDLIKSKGDLEGAGIHDRPQLHRIARRFGLLGPISQFARPTTILKRLRLHEQYLATDDSLLRQELEQIKKTPDVAASEALSTDELDLAVEERGLWYDDQSHEDRSSALQAWLAYPVKTKD